LLLELPSQLVLVQPVLRLQRVRLGPQGLLARERERVVHYMQPEPSHPQLKT
jgi:hypothetical protein